jgi:class 3 adenylate cyclase
MDRAHGATLTLLFTDVVSSTEVSVRLGADAHALRRAHDRILREQFDACGGSVVKHTGDGFFVTFPSATQGVDCAARIQQAIAAERAEGRYLDLAIRIGLHTGEPVVEDGDYFGVDVAIASRIMAEATGGDVLVSDITYQLARSRMSLGFEPAGARALKGLPDPVTLHRVRWDLEPPQPHASLFVGRAAERQRLAARLDAALHGRGSIVLVTGDGGLGKTRLARELCIEARDRGMLVLTGRAFDADALLPYRVVSDALRAHLRERTPDDVRALLADDAPLLAKLIPELSGAIAGLPVTMLLTPEAERYELFEAITRTLIRLVRPSGGVLFLDDLHWADRTTVRLVEHLARRVGQAPLLVLVTYRDAELPTDHPLAALPYEVTRAAAGEHIALEPLSRLDAGLLAAHVLGAQLPAALADELYATAEGNPFFTEQLVGHMRDRAAADPERARKWEAPDSVRHLLLGRLDRLGEDTHDLLVACAVLGRDLTPARIVAATGAADDRVIAALDEALGARVLREERGAYSFAHALIKDTVYQSLRAPRRQLLHHQIAAGLERLYRDEIESHVQELAHHFLESAKGGADIAKAADYARRAAAQASAVFAYDEAATYFRRAADAVAASGANSAERCELTIAMGEMLMRAGNAPGADEAFQTGAGIARSLGRADLLARAALGLGDVRRTGGIVDAPLIALLGDVVISVETARRQAKRGLYAELLHLASHGLCHLLGYDHRDDEEEHVMNARAAKLRKEAARTGRVKAA